MSFTRWERTTCPNTQRLYDGLVTGSRWSETESAGYLCLHKQPQFLSISPGVQRERSYIYGTEFRSDQTAPAFSNKADHDIPCAVCYAPTRTAQITISGRTSCPPSWTREFYGYLMAEQHSHDGVAVPICVDANAEAVPGSSGGTMTHICCSLRPGVKEYRVHHISMGQKKPAVCCVH